MRTKKNTILPTVMNAFRFYKANDPKSIIYEKVDIPELKDQDVLVKVYAGSITRDELSWPVDRLPAIPSYEFSGVVVALGSKVKNWKIHDQVYGLSPFSQNGAAAEYINVPSNILALKPKNLSFVESSTIPLAVLTVWQGLFEHGMLQEGQRVLIHGAAGGVGHFAVQIAHEIGAYVIGTTSSLNLDKVRSYGADEVIDYTKVNFDEVVKDIDLIFDTAGGTRLSKSMSVVKDGGRIVSIAGEVPKVGSQKKNIKTDYFVVEPNDEQLQQITNLIEKGVLHPTIDKIYPISDIQDAFERSLSKKASGKIVLEIANEKGMLNSKIIVLSYLKCLHNHKFEEAGKYLGQKIKIKGPAGEKFTNTKDFLKMMEVQQGKYKIRKVFVDEKNVCVFYDFTNPKVTAGMASWYIVEENKIISLQTIFDSKLFNPSD